MKTSSAFALLLTGIAAFTAAAPATAQTAYYMRERIVGVPKKTFTATYSQAYGACTNGKQSAPIVSCRSSDGTDAPLSSCGAQTTTKDCVVQSCGPLQQYNSYSGGSLSNIGRAANADEARTMCNAANRPFQAGACYYQASSTGGTGPLYLVTGASRLDPTANPNLWASLCQ